MVYSTDRSEAVLVLLFVALWFILRGDFFYVLPCVILFLCFSVLLALLGEERTNLSAFRTLFDLCLDLSVSSSSWCLGRVAFRDCGTPWTFLLPFFTNVSIASESNKDLPLTTDSTKLFFSVWIFYICP